MSESLMRRRELLKLAVGAPFVALRQSVTSRGRSAGLARASFERAPWRILTTDGRPAPGVQLERAWNGEICRSRGMQAVLRGSCDAFILGCNHPIWASAGLIHGSRSSNDIKRTWERIATTGRQNLYRNWQNGRLWWNDPDAIVLTGDLPEAEFQFHASVIFASGGMVLSGDDLTTISKDRMAMLRKLQPPPGVAARFEDASLRGGIVERGRDRVACFFNWEDEPRAISVTVPGPCRLRDFWTDEERGRHAGGRLSVELPPHSARLLVCSTT